MSPEKRFEIGPCAVDDVQQLRDELGMSRVLAETLVRRGWTDPQAVRVLLDSEGSLHDPLALGDAAQAIPLIQAAITARQRIVVHGDYDADGVCATAVLCEGLAALGADVTPFIPSRFDEGYGLAVETVERLHAEAAQLIITVDCGITAVAAAARARELGVALIITDHHRALDTLPDCPIVAPALRGQYPFDALCGAGTAYKLLEGLVLACQADPAILDSVIDLVAIATIADLVPLIDENRALECAVRVQRWTGTRRHPWCSRRALGRGWHEPLARLHPRPRSGYPRGRSARHSRHPRYHRALIGRSETAQKDPGPFVQFRSAASHSRHARS